MIKIAHITDPHLPPLPKMQPGEVTIKRILGHLSWHRKRKAVHSAEVLEALQRDLETQAPQHIHVSGDLTNLALGSEYAQARRWLETIGSPERVSVIPGNHEFHHAGMYEAITRHWLPYASGDADADIDKGVPSNEARFPFMRVLGDVALIGMNSAYKTPSFMATGRVDQAELARLGEVLERCKQKGLFRLISIHHPVQIGATQWHRSLQNADAVRAVIDSCGAELVIHGHLHRPVRGEIERSDDAAAPIAVRGAASCSSRGGGHSTPAHYHVMEIKQGTEGWIARIHHRQLNLQSFEFEEVEIENLSIDVGAST